jgi:hypothetical protein
VFFGGETGWELRLRRQWVDCGFRRGRGRNGAVGFELGEAIAGFFGGGGMGIIGDQPAEEGDGLVELIEFTGIDIGEVDGGPAPAFGWEFMFEDFLVFECGGEGIEEIFFVDFGDAEGDVEFAWIFEEMFAHESDGIQEVTLVPFFLCFFVFGNDEAFAFVVVEDFEGARAEEMGDVVADEEGETDQAADESGAPPAEVVCGFGFGCGLVILRDLHVDDVGVINVGSGGHEGVVVRFELPGAEAGGAGEQHVKHKLDAPIHTRLRGVTKPG